MLNFKEAIIAHLNGESVEARLPNSPWRPLARDFQFVDILNIHAVLTWQFRIKPRTILVHGVEVPAPVTEPLQDGRTYCVPDPTAPTLFYSTTWGEESRLDEWRLEKGLVYLESEDAQARAKVML